MAEVYYYPELSKIVLDAAYKVHSSLGPGLFESVYEACMEYELTKRGCKVERQLSLPVEYEGVFLAQGYRVDLLVDNSIILELKSVEALHDVHFKQLITYLRLSQKKVGYLMNFNVSSFKDGFHRKVL